MLRNNFICNENLVASGRVHSNIDEIDQIPNKNQYMRLTKILFPQFVCVCLCCENIIFENIFLIYAPYSLNQQYPSDLFSIFKAYLSNEFSQVQKERMCDAVIARKTYMFSLLIELLLLLAVLHLISLVFVYPYVDGAFLFIFFIHFF